MDVQKGKQGHYNTYSQVLYKFSQILEPTSSID